MLWLLPHCLRQSQPDVLQVWYADDATAAGQIITLMFWLKHFLAYSQWLLSQCSKSMFMVKPDQLHAA